MQVGPSYGLRNHRSLPDHPLAIPIHPKAHGKSPRVFPLLQFAATRAGVKLLGLPQDGGFLALYVLKSKVTQPRDPKALPTDATMAKALESAGDIHLRKI